MVFSGIFYNEKLLINRWNRKYHDSRFKSYCDRDREGSINYNHSLKAYKSNQKLIMLSRDKPQNVQL
ncbi:hypothetical protein APE02nite_08610 [Alkalibacterium pelagium]|nr:hypothetical protein APE02nite_08610 [Alkalibacterium pelagium]